MNGVLWVPVVLGGLVGVWAIAIWNRFVRLGQHLKESWADIDVELKRRYELIPNLVATVKGYARHEREVLERVVALRGRALENQGTPASQGGDETNLMLGVKQLFAVAEAYPELKADQRFRELQKELALTEDRIAASRRFYNGNVRALAVMRRTFPTNLVGRLLGVEEPSYFELADESERVVPRVDLDR
ncbi:MAG: LemA family protein [Gemmatimonadota bacterium]